MLGSVNEKPGVQIYPLNEGENTLNELSGFDFLKQNQEGGGNPNKYIMK